MQKQWLHQDKYIETFIKQSSSFILFWSHDRATEDDRASNERENTDLKQQERQASVHRFKS